MKKLKIFAFILSFVLAFTIFGPFLAGASTINEDEQPPCDCMAKLEGLNLAPLLVDPNTTGPAGGETVNGVLYSKYHISADKAVKIGKALAAGAGAAALASEFGIPPVVAAVLVFLYGGNELCNWNNKGYTIYYSSLVRLGFCVPD